MTDRQIPPPAPGTTYYVFQPPTPNESTITPNPPFPSGVLDLSDIPVHLVYFIDELPADRFVPRYSMPMSGFPDFPGLFSYFSP